MIDYGICTREVVGLEDVGAESIRWDVFISAYNESERVQRVFERVRAKRKLWLVQREYGLESGQFPNGAFAADTRQEADFWRAFGVFAGAEWADGRVCVDITGFMRPQLVFLTVWLLAIKKKGFVAMYSDPIHYTQREETVFSKGPVTEVRQISGCEGIHDSNTGGDCLVIGMGYDDELVRRVAEAKDDARKIQLYGWPSLEPDMYQESVLRSFKANEAFGQWGDERCFAPANDPFATAGVLQKQVQVERQSVLGLTNLYLAPVGTKPQTLGFALYFGAP